jgi:hypothetical protein
MKEMIMKNESIGISAEKTDEKKNENSREV